MTSTQRPQPPLPWLPEDFGTALAVAAHPDDLEYGAAAAVARWTDQGRQVAYLLLTRGEAGIDTVSPEESAPLREREQRAACAAVGADDVDFAGLPDGVLQPDLAVRRAIARAVRRVRPEVVVANASRDWGGVPDQADHRALAAVLVDAVRDAGNRWVFRELLDEGLEPWGGVREVVHVMDAEPTHAVDTTATLDRGMASLRAHETYWEVLGSSPEEMLRAGAAEAGARQGVGTAVLVRRQVLQAG
ncbi:PIG-L deacetylase family protein [uncultured Pseudokineococcus sp.]|uniref:PIG-L deacetylase family protein n=1 Tax=uncultured Pseudokineococcus sp. TaxID=1642928 RepID=UPI0026119C98|nr:PIG-L deacetylase family protein [uncultured Pseudokineococcus sp.]